MKDDKLSVQSMDFAVSINFLYKHIKARLKINLAFCYTSTRHSAIS